ncbi:MAG: undecaprenyl/decaprenyl-phosphate alpha-N-acetylglucosaminyl 1-phosphate transferase [Candidatus Omnitrophica bacterium]|nr:undecaprenyl/decaprenyl-phosphate alpha-N-acetylglucosaminyl 1-phosphate transferase [Candidatus Omnitrophota bacterium]
MSSIIQAFLIALTFAIVITPIARYLALKSNFVDIPNDERKIHKKSIPLLGGWAIYLSIVLTCLFKWDLLADKNLIFTLGAITLLLIIGTLDDKGMLNSQTKLIIGMPIASLVLISIGIRIDFFSMFLKPPYGNILDILFTLFWITGFTASFSILDHMDGLNVGITAIASAFFLVHFINCGYDMLAVISAICLGSSVGFLVFNFHPAKIFLGDGGAMITGFLMAFLSLKMPVQNRYIVSRVVTPLLILVVPFFDTSLCIFSRSRRGLLPPTAPGKDHIAHRLMKSGFGQKKTAMILYTMAILGGVLSLFLSALSKTTTCIFILISIVIYVSTILSIERLPYEK